MLAEKQVSKIAFMGPGAIVQREVLILHAAELGPIPSIHTALESARGDAWMQSQE